MLYDSTNVGVDKKRGEKREGKVNVKNTQCQGNPYHKKEWVATTSPERERERVSE